jgi:LacI family transcriptional regulator
VAQKSARRGSNFVTIHEVARHAGVSPMTVSRVVNGGINVREETRERVSESIKVLNYSPNLAARSLASARALRLGVLYNSRSALHLSDFLAGGLEQAGLSGCQLGITRCDDAEGERAAIKRFVETGIDGVILPPPLCDSEAALNAIADAGIPAVVVATQASERGHSAVGIDDFQASCAMTRNLVALGHSRIAFIMGDPGRKASDERYKGYLAGMEEAGIGHDPAHVVQGNCTYRSGFDAAEKLLATNSRPTAIFASNDDMAVATVVVAHRLGLSVPRDLTMRASTTRRSELRSGRN